MYGYSLKGLGRGHVWGYYYSIFSMFIFLSFIFAYYMQDNSSQCLACSKYTGNASLFIDLNKRQVDYDLAYSLLLCLSKWYYHPSST